MYVHFEMPFDTSNLPGAGPISSRIITLLKTGRRASELRLDHLGVGALGAPPLVEVLAPSQHHMQHTMLRYGMI